MLCCHLSVHRTAMNYHSALDLRTDAPRQPGPTVFVGQSDTGSQLYVPAIAKLVLRLPSEAGSTETL
jgi:hypothetical protein